MHTAGVAVVVDNFDPESPAGEQFVPSVLEKGQPEVPPAGSRDETALEQLREEFRALQEAVAAIDRRDAAQHGGLKGEIAHLVRRIARLEALPKVRQAR